MQVFISWSGSRSQYVAKALYEWLPSVIQAVDPWMSDIDIENGTVSALEIGRALERHKVGILCLTPENQRRPWISFEAGALAKTVETAYVIPYLIELPRRELIAPLSQFQNVVADEEGSLGLVTSINKAMGDEGLPLDKLSDSYRRCWPELKDRLSSLPATAGEPQPKRDTDEILEEILLLTRGISTQLGDAARGQNIDEFERIRRAIALAGGSSTATGALLNEVSRVRNMINHYPNPPVSGGIFESLTYIPPASEDTSHLHDDPGKEGKSA